MNGSKETVALATLGKERPQETACDLLDEGTPAMLS